MPVRVEAIMPKFLVTLEAEVYVEVEADDELTAEGIAMESWTKNDVEILDAIDVQRI